MYRILVLGLQSDYKINSLTMRAYMKGSEARELPVASSTICILANMGRFQHLALEYSNCGFNLPQSRFVDLCELYYLRYWLRTANQGSQLS